MAPSISLGFHLIRCCFSSRYHGPVDPTTSNMCVAIAHSRRERCSRFLARSQVPKRRRDRLLCHPLKQRCQRCVGPLSFAGSCRLTSKVFITAMAPEGTTLLTHGLNMHTRSGTRVFVAGSQFSEFTTTFANSVVSLRRPFVCCVRRHPFTRGGFGNKEEETCHVRKERL